MKLILAIAAVLCLSCAAESRAGCLGKACSLATAPVRAVVEAQPVRSVLRAQPLRRVAALRPGQRIVQGVRKPLGRLLGR